jgi:hypothetical protein
MTTRPVEVKRKVVAGRPQFMLDGNRHRCRINGQGKPVDFERLSYGEWVPLRYSGAGWDWHSKQRDKAAHRQRLLNALAEHRVKPVRRPKHQPSQSIRTTMQAGAPGLGKRR